MSHFHLRGGVTHCEDVAAAGDRRGGRHAGLRLFGRCDAQPGAGAARRSVRRCDDPLIALCGQGQSQYRGADHAGGGRAGRRCRVRRRISPRPRGRDRARQDRLLRRRQDRRRDARSRSRGGLCQFNLESLAEAEMLSAGRARDGPDGAGRVPGQSRCRRRLPRQDLDRRGPQQVRHPDRRRAGRLRRRCAACRGSSSRAWRSTSAASSPASRRWRRRSTKLGAMIAELRAQGHDISTADLGGGLGIRYDPVRAAAAERSRIMARWSRAADARLGRAADLRARPADRRRRRRAADRGRPGQAGRQQSRS